MKQAASLKKHLRESPDLQKLRHKRRMARVRLRTILGVFFVVLFIGLIYLVRYPKLQIVTITVSGNQSTATSDIVSHIDQFLAGDYAYVIPHSNAFLYQKSKIIADLLSSFPRLRSVSVYRTSLTAIHVDVSEVHAIALWCGTDITTIDASVPCYFTDDAGKVVAPAPYYSGNVYSRFFGSTLISSGEDPIGHQFIAPVTFQNLIVFADHVNSSGFAIKGITIGPADEYDFVLDLGENKTALLRFEAADDYTVLAENFAAAVSKTELAAEIKSDKTNLEYFDLRFANKVYYKFSDTPVSTPPPAKQ